MGVGGGRRKLKDKIDLVELEGHLGQSAAYLSVRHVPNEHETSTVPASRQ